MSEFNEINVKISAVYSDESQDKAYIWGFTNSALYEYDYENKQTRLLTTFDGVCFRDWAQQGNMIRVNDELVITPLKSNKILKYNLSTEKGEVFTIPPSICSSGYKREVLLLDNKCVLFPQNSNDAIIEYSVDVNKIDINKKLCKIFNGVSKRDYAVSVSEKSIFAYFDSQKQLIIIDRFSLEVRDVIAVNIIHQIKDIVSVDESVWFLPYKEFDAFEMNEKLIEYKCLDNGWINDNGAIPYSDVVSCNDELILLNYYSKNIMKINKSKRELQKLVSYSEYGCLDEKVQFGGCYGAATSWGGRLWIWPIMCDRGLFFDGEKFETFDIVCNVNNIEQKLQLLGSEMAVNGIASESDYSINTYIEYLSK